MKKKLFAILLSIVMVVGLLPVTALAADPTVYGIWVDGVQVTSENKDNLCSGTVSYEPTTHTLSLNNATLDIQCIQALCESGKKGRQIQRTATSVFSQPDK